MRLERQHEVDNMQLLTIIACGIALAFFIMSGFLLTDVKHQKPGVECMSAFDAKTEFQKLEAFDSCHANLLKL